MYAFRDSFPFRPTRVIIFLASSISFSGNFFKNEFIFPILGNAPIKTFSNTEIFFTKPKL